MCDSGTPCLGLLRRGAGCHSHGCAELCCKVEVGGHPSVGVGAPGVREWQPTALWGLVQSCEAVLLLWGCPLDSFGHQPPSVLRLSLSLGWLLLRSLLLRLSVAHAAAQPWCVTQCGGCICAYACAAASCVVLAGLWVEVRGRTCGQLEPRLLCCAVLHSRRPACAVPGGRQGFPMVLGCQCQYRLTTIPAHALTLPAADFLLTEPTLSSNALLWAVHSPRGVGWH